MSRQYVSVADKVKIASFTVPSTSASIRSLAGNDWPQGEMILQGVLTANAAIVIKDTNTNKTFTLPASTSKNIPAQDFGSLHVSHAAGTAVLVVEIYSQLDAGDQ